MLILIADDHKLMRETLADNVMRLDPKSPIQPIEILEAGSYDELYQIADSGHAPDLILLDFEMPGVDGIAGISRLLAAFSKSPVMVVSGSVDSALAMSCIDAGAMGFIPKSVSGKALRNAMRVVLDGEKYVHTFAMTRSATGSAGAPQAQSKLPRWSEREQQIVDSLIAGKTNKQIARELDLQEMTVKTHVRNVYRKLGAVNRADAVRMVLEGRENTGERAGGGSKKN